MTRSCTLAMALVAGATIVASTLPSAIFAQTSADAPKARFSDVNAYTGKPDLPVTVSMVVAGGGPSSFDSTKLVGVLAGDKTSAEVASLQKKFGEENVKSFLTVFNFVVNDALKYVTEAKIALPQPSPDPKDGKALAAALYKLGVNPAGSFDVEYMLDGLVSHGIHVKVMDDIDAKYGAKADGNYHAVLTQAMTDLKSAYGL
jgi:hypothetical protein